MVALLGMVWCGAVTNYEPLEGTFCQHQLLTGRCGAAPLGLPHVVYPYRSGVPLDHTS
jgi:hypothetical protein